MSPALRQRCRAKRSQHPWWAWSDCGWSLSELAMVMPHVLAMTHFRKPHRGHRTDTEKGAAPCYSKVELSAPGALLLIAV